VGIPRGRTAHRAVAHPLFPFSCKPNDRCRVKLTPAQVRSHNAVDEAGAAAHDMAQGRARLTRRGVFIAIALALTFTGCAKKNKDPVTATSGPVEEETTTLAAGFRSHIVAPQETLYRLAVMYYGDGKQWQKIYYANRKRIADPSDLPVGIRLIIPPRDEATPDR